MQANEYRQFLKNYEWDVIITSPLKRAKEIAEIINKDSNMPLVEMRVFLVRYIGNAEGMTLVERLTAFPNRNYPNHEDRNSLNKRIMNSIENINENYSGKKILLVLHGSVINTILAKFLMVRSVQERLSK